MEMMKEKLENSSAFILDLKRKLTKATTDSELWKTKYESEAVSKIDEIEDQNSKLKTRLVEAEYTYQELTSNYEGLKKNKHQFCCELEDVKNDLANVKNINGTLEKKINEFDIQNDKQKKEMQIVNEQLVQEIKKNKSYCTDLVDQRELNDNLNQNIVSQQQENNNLMARIQNLSEQNESLERKIVSTEQSKRRTESEKDELSVSIENLEFELEKADQRLKDSNKNVEKIKVDNEKRLEELENEMKHSRSIFQNALEVAQVDIEAERKAHSECLRSNQKLQNDIQALEFNLDNSSR